MDIDLPLLCLRVISALLPHETVYEDMHFEERKQICIEVAEEAKIQDVDILTALAVTWQESRFLNAGTNSSGCSGPLQIKIKYWCPNSQGEWSPVRADGVIEGCDLIERGVFTLKYYLKRFKHLKNSLCAYGWGKCDTPERMVYVNSTMRYRRIIEKTIKQVMNEKCND